MSPEEPILSTDMSDDGQAVRTIVGKYQVIRKLASGGMGDVYLARQKGPVAFNRLVVLKTLHREFTADESFVSMFLNEAQLVANLAHPNIIHIYELFQEEAGYVIAMEYVRGGSVLEVLRGCQSKRETALPYGPAIRIVTAVCDALQYAYNERSADGVPLRIIHRDISPSNILVGLDGQVKLVDFGIAKALASEPLTKTSTIKGKAGYLAPEQIRTQVLDQRCDIFGLGVVLWEMTVGERLFRRDNDLQTMNAILNEPLPLPSSKVDDYPPGLEKIVMKATARDREDRYPDAQSFAADCRALARELNWDVEAAALSSVVEEMLPDEQLVIGFDPTPMTSPSSPPVRSGARLGRFGVGSGVGSGSGMKGEPRLLGSQPDLSLKRSNTSAWITFGVMLLATAMFWLLIVPAL